MYPVNFQPQPAIAMGRATHILKMRRVPIANAQAEETLSGVKKILNAARGERAKIGAAFWGLKKEGRSRSVLMYETRCRHSSRSWLSSNSAQAQTRLLSAKGVRVLSRAALRSAGHLASMPISFARGCTLRGSTKSYLVN